ncbi:MAG: glutathione binding-like protein, partial [Rhodospirillaceae bacterium]
GHWVIRSPDKVPQAQKHYDGVLRDMLATLDKRLGDSAFVAGPTYTVADISMYPDIHLHGVQDVGLDAYPNVSRWHDTIAARPAVKKAWEMFS